MNPKLLLFPVMVLCLALHGCGDAPVAADAPEPSVAAVPPAKAPPVAKVDPAVAKRKAAKEKAEANRLEQHEKLMTAIIDTDARGVRKALRAGASVHDLGPDGDPPLFMAAYRGDKNIIKLLIKAGAKINDKSHDGMTVLDESIAQGHTKLSEYLRSRGAKSTGIGEQRQAESPYVNDDHWDNPAPLR